MPRFKSAGITIKLSEKLKNFLEKISKENQMSQAEFIRYLLQKYMDEYEEAIELTNELYEDEDEKREEILSWIVESYERDKEIQRAINDLYPSQKLEIQPEYKLEIEGNYVYTIGRIKNVSDKPVSYFEIKVDFLDDDEQVLNSDYTNDGLKLNPGDMREFKIMTKWNSDYKKYRLSIGDVK